MSQNRLYVDVHILQTLPPNCINRDDTGSPKTALYGGVTRARVSSQAWKKAVRQAFKEIFPQELLGMRTKAIVDLLAKELAQQGYEGDATQAAIDLFGAAGLTIKSQEDGTGAMFFISQAQIKALAAFALTRPEIMLSEPPKGKSKAKPKPKKDQAAQLALSSSPGVDIALFGRMVADDPSLNIDASCQVAHAISTHKVSNEYDYFTAVDDVADLDHAGAAHIGTVEFSAATLYRYATVAVHDLHASLGQDTARAVQGFVKAFALSMPTGKQNTFANRTLPDSLLLTIRADQPINLVAAFEKPVASTEDGHVAQSEKRLVSYAKDAYLDFASAPLHSFVVGEGLSALGQRLSLDQVLVRLGEVLEEALP